MRSVRIRPGAGKKKRAPKRPQAGEKATEPGTGRLPQTRSAIGALAVRGGVEALALVVLGIAWRRLRQGTLTSGYFLGAQTFWYFVVGMWPIIYARVYF